MRTCKRESCENTFEVNSGRGTKNRKYCDDCTRGRRGTCVDCENQIKEGSPRCRSCATKNQWQNPVIRDHITKRIREAYSNPELRHKQSVSKLQLWRDTSFRTKTVAGMNKPEVIDKAKRKSELQQKDPRLRKRLSEKMKIIANSPEAKDRVAKWAKKQWKTLEFRKNMSGENHPNWRGGNSAPYPPEWNESLRLNIRERDEYHCANCGRDCFGDDRNPDVHHIDGDKQNCHESNLITLCASCHMKVEGVWKDEEKRLWYINYFRQYLHDIGVQPEY